MGYRTNICTFLPECISTPEYISDLFATYKGDSEDLIGKCNPSRRADIFLATKFGLDENFATRSDPEFIRLQLETSLTKLQTDHIDLYYQHRPDTKVPIEVTVKALVEFVK